MDVNGTSLVRGSKSLMALSKARQYLAKTTDLMAVLDMRDQAEAIRHLRQAADVGLDAQNEAAEIKIRAERRAGELLASMRANGNRAGRGGDRKSKGHDVILKLSDIGIEPKESSRFQRAAALPEKAFAKYVAEAIEARKELTSVEVRRRAKAYLKAKQRKQERKVRGKSAKGIIVTNLAELEGRKFGTVYADPPWKYGNQSTRAATDEHYGTMTVADICAMPIESFVADDAHLHLWTTNAFLREAFDVIDAWGFEYRSVFVWCKPQLGIGNYWRVSHEFLLLGIRGDAKQFEDHNLRSWLESPRSGHSRKPEEVRGMIEIASPGPYLELFGRRAVNHWTVYGNEVEQTLFA